MNSFHPAHRLTTNAAEGLPRRSFTVAEMEKMSAAGILNPDERLELIGGEIVPMSPKGNQHEALKAALLETWYRIKPAELMLIPETTLRLSEDTYLEPDIVVYRRADGLTNLSAQTALLIVEIADASLAYDLGKKARIYAGFGIAELWVIDAIKLQTRVHRDPSQSGFRDIADWPADVELVPTLAPGLAVTLAALDLGL